MFYNLKFERLVDGIEFTAEDPCIWVVYPPGAAGDLLASLINFHFINTGSKYFGIADRGQVIFRPSDGKIINQKYLKGNDVLLDNQFLHDVNTELGNKNLNYGMLDQIIFSSHSYKNSHVKQIKNFFPKSKIIRLMPGDMQEQNLAYWMGVYKNQNILIDYTTTKKFLFDRVPKHIHDYVLDINLTDIINKTKFEITYDKIIEFLNLPCKLIRFDFIEYWISNQHPTIRPILQKLGN